MVMAMADTIIKSITLVNRLSIIRLIPAKYVIIRVIITYIIG